jgi:hypothetical protein
MLNNILPNLDTLQIMAGISEWGVPVNQVKNSTPIALLPCTPFPSTVYGLEVLFSGNIMPPTLMPDR